MGARNVVVPMLVLLALSAHARPQKPPAGDSEIAAGKFLIASDYHMSDPKFKGSVILLVRHEPEAGTVGLILNHPTRMTVHDAFPGIKEAHHLASTVFIGGPVRMRNFVMLVRTNEASEGLMRVLNGVSFSSDADTILKWLSREYRADRIRIFAGYSGWGAGQLAMEIQLNGWRLLPADARTVFDIAPENLWPELARRQPGTRTSVPGTPQRPSAR